MSILFDGELLADYHQIYLADGAGSPALPKTVPARAIRQRMQLAPGVLVFMTARNMTVPVRVERHAAEPAPSIERADHIVVGGMSTSGIIAIAGLSDFWPKAHRATVPAGDLQVMVVSRGLGTLSTDELEGADRYEVHLWPGRATGVRVLKQWEEG